MKRRQFIIAGLATCAASSVSVMATSEPTPEDKVREWMENMGSPCGVTHWTDTRHLTKLGEGMDLIRQLEDGPFKTQAKEFHMAHYHRKLCDCGPCFQIWRDIVVG